ncbi:MAG: hypothetical protein ACR2JC_20880 [Chloroflexota bacterium]
MTQPARLPEPICPERARQCSQAAAGAAAYALAEHVLALLESHTTRPDQAETPACAGHHLELLSTLRERAAPSSPIYLGRR